jgi:histidinol-phosphate aminotransferase
LSKIYLSRVSYFFTFSTQLFRFVTASFPAAEAELRVLLDEQCLVIVDEAYAEFASWTAVPLLARYPNLVVMRTFSKWAGLAGLRVGYMAAHPSIVAKIVQIKQPYNVCAGVFACGSCSLP